MLRLAGGGLVDRRSFLVSVGIGLAGSTGLGSVSSAAGAVPLVDRTRTGPVVEWEWVGGFVGPGVATARAPRLVAYADGLAIADAGRQLRLDRRSLTELRRQMAAVLADPASTRRRPGAPVIADAPAARFAVHAANGRHFTAAVDGLEESRPQHAYPQRLYALSDRLSKVRLRVTSRGAPFEPAAVRLVAVVDSAPGSSGAARWPRGIPVPAIAHDAYIGQVDLRGPAARTVKRSIPRRSPWPEYRTADGRVLRVSWRFLLPHE